MRMALEVLSPAMEWPSIGGTLWFTVFATLGENRDQCPRDTCPLIEGGFPPLKWEGSQMSLPVPIDYPFR